METTVYKVVYNNKGKLQSCSPLPKWWVHRYKKDKTVYPKKGRGLLFAFRTLENVKQFILTAIIHGCRNLQTWEAEAEIIQHKPLMAMSAWWPDSHLHIKEFWARIGTPMDTWKARICPNGTIWCEWIKLTRRITAVEGGWHE